MWSKKNTQKIKTVFYFKKMYHRGIETTFMYKILWVSYLKTDLKLNFHSPLHSHAITCVSGMKFRVYSQLFIGWTAVLQIHRYLCVFSSLSARNWGCVYPCQKRHCHITTYQAYRTNKNLCIQIGTCMCGMSSTTVGHAFSWCFPEKTK